MVLLVLRVAFSSAAWKHPYGQAQGYISYVILNPGQADSEDDPPTGHQVYRRLCT